MRHSIYGATLACGGGHLVRVESEISRGLSRIIVVGMPDAVTREARERLPSALPAHGFIFPKGKVLFNLYPSQIPKRGLPLDLAMAMSTLASQGKLSKPFPATLFLAELDLQGRLGPPARGTILATLEAAKQNVKQIITAHESVHEAAMVPGVTAFAFSHLGEVVDFLLQSKKFKPAKPVKFSTSFKANNRLDEVRGQSQARQAVLIAAVGRHSLLLQGPPGTGKSLLAQRINQFLPPLAPEQALSLATMEAQFGPLVHLPTHPPFRAPHHTISAQGMLGGGQPLRPGELSRAHCGVLFLDELPEYARPVLEGLRQPLEEKEVRVQRAREWANFPADCLLVAARNPCPCGYATHPDKPCTCTSQKLANYLLKTSGPLLDRFDLFVEMGPVSAAVLQGPPTPPHDEDCHQLAQKALAFQGCRRKKGGIGPAGNMPLEHLKQLGVKPGAKQLLANASESMQLSGRGLVRCLRVARTLADLEESEKIDRPHVLNSLAFRFQNSDLGLG
jgi:magnesium chelatase family protein